MLAAEQIKYRKHELANSHTGYSFVALCIWALCFFVLAMLELREHEAIRNQQGLDPLTTAKELNIGRIVPALQGCCCYGKSNCHAPG
jgi:hypothetical protein